MNKTDRIYVAGHTGMVGRAVVRRLEADGYLNVLIALHSEVDLCNKTQVRKFFEKNQIDHVIMCAGLVGGLFFNQSNRFEMLYKNTLMALHTIHAAKESKVKTFCYLGSSCQYPEKAQIPLEPEDLLSGFFAESNEGYALAKSVGFKACEIISEDLGYHFFTAIPCNIYGPFDNFSYLSSHLIAGIMSNCHYAKKVKEKVVILPGTGQARRELLHVDDLSCALIYLMNNYKGSRAVNIGTGFSHTVRDIANMIRAVTDAPPIVFDGDPTRDGVLDKTLEVSSMSAWGWKPTIKLTHGLTSLYQWALQNKVLI